MALPGLPPPMAKTNATTATASSNVMPGVSAGGTNATVTATAKPASGQDDVDEREHPPAPDAPMLETEQILLDYLSLLRKNNVATAGH